MGDWMTTFLQNDFDDGILKVTGHRPWPMPDSAWVMTQTWHDLLFAHWPVDVSALRALVPAGFELDLYGTQAWLGIVPFHMTNVAPRGIPALPWISAFPELNVRTYVRVNGRPGVYFFSLDAGNPVAVGAARALFHLPYYTAEMSVETVDGSVEYRSRRITSGAPPAAFDARYQPISVACEPEPGSLEHFLTERYCLFTVDHDSRAYVADIHHPPWLLQQAEAEIRVNTMADAAGVPLPGMSPLLHFARRQDAVAWPIRGC